MSHEQPENVITKTQEQSEKISDPFVQTVERIFASEEPQAEALIAFAQGAMTETQIDEIIRVFNGAIKESDIDRDELASMVEAGLISEQTKDAFLAQIAEKEPSKVSRLFERVKELEKEYADKNIPHSVRLAIQKEYKNSVDSKEYRDGQRMLVGTLLAEAEREEDTKKGALNSLDLFYGDKDVELGWSLKTLYSFLYTNKLFEWPRYPVTIETEEGPKEVELPGATVTHFIDARNTFADYKARGGMVDRERELEVRAAIEEIEQFILHLPGWEDAKERILIEQGIDSQEQLVNMQKSRLFPTREEVVDHMEAQIIEERERAAGMIRDALSDSSPVLASPLLRGAKQLVEHSEFLEAQTSTPEGRATIDVEQVPEFDRNFYEAQALTELAHIINQSIMSRETQLAINKKELRAASKTKARELKRKNDYMEARISALKQTRTMYEKQVDKLLSRESVGSGKTNQ